jgi:hypothetical protein
LPNGEVDCAEFRRKSSAFLDFEIEKKNKRRGSSSHIHTLRPSRSATTSTETRVPSGVILELPLTGANRFAV